MFVLHLSDLHMLVQFSVHISRCMHTYTHNLTEFEIRHWNNTLPSHSVLTTATLGSAMKS